MSFRILFLRRERYLYRLAGTKYHHQSGFHPFEIKDVDKGVADADVGAFGDAMGLGTPAVLDEDGGVPNWC
jgi:hypothetical protein